MINHVNEVTTRGGRAIALAAEHPALRPTSTTISSCPAGPLLRHPARAAGAAHRLPHERRAGHRPRLSAQSEQDPDGGLAVIWLWVSIIIITLVGVAVGRYPWLRMNRATNSLVGATALVILGAISLEQAYAAIDLNTITLLLAMMILNMNLRLAGFFRLVSQWVVKRARTSRLLLALIVVFSGVLSALFLNDTVVLMFTPLVLDTTEGLRRNPVPYLIGLVTSANIGEVGSDDRGQSAKHADRHVLPDSIPNLYFVSCSCGVGRIGRHLVVCAVGVPRRIFIRAIF